jgi:hypothetical protein
MTRLPPSAAGRRLGVAWPVGSGPSDPRGGGSAGWGEDLAGWPVGCRVPTGGAFS